MNEVTPQAHLRSMIRAIVSFYIQRRYFYLSEQHGLWIDCILTEELTMHKMIPTDFVLMLPNILGHKCTCIKSHDQSRLTPSRVRQEFFYTLLGMQEMPVHSGLSMQHISSHLMAQFHNALSSLQSWLLRRQALAVGTHNLTQNNGKRNLYTQNCLIIMPKTIGYKLVTIFSICMCKIDKMTKTGTADFIKVVFRIRRMQ